MLTVLRFPDVQPWEWAFFQPIITGLASRHPVTVAELDPLDRGARRRGFPGPVWLIARDWRTALRMLGPRGEAPIFVSVIEMGVPKRHLSTLFLKSFAERLPAGVRLLTYSPLSHRFLREMEGIAPEHVLSATLPLPEVPTVSPGMGKVIAGRVTVGTFAPFVAESNLHHLLTVAHYVCAANPAAHFRIVGAGPLYRHLRAIARDVDLESRVTIDEATHVGDMASSEIFLYMPLRNDHFGPLLAAAAAKLPVLATEMPGIENFITDGADGFVVPVNETKPMAELVLRLIDAPALRKSLGMKLAQKLADHLSAERLIGEWETIFFGGGTLEPEPRAVA